MSHLLLFCALSLALLSRPAQAQLLTPADTLANYTQLVGIISESWCAKLMALSTRPDYNHLSAAQSQRLMRGLAQEIVLENQWRLETSGKHVSARSRRSYFHPLGRAGFLQMTETCPAAPRLLADLYARALPDKAPIGEPEQAVLQPIATNICQRLMAAGQLQPLESRPEAESQDLVRLTSHEVVLAHAPELTRYYGEGIMNDEDQLGKLCLRISLLMIGQCPKYVFMLNSLP